MNYFKTAFLTVIAALSLGSLKADNLDNQINMVQTHLNEASGALNTLSQEVSKFDQRQRELSKRCPFGKVTDNCVGDWIQFGLDAAAMLSKRAQQASESQIAADLNNQLKQLKEQRAAQGR